MSDPDPTTPRPIIHAVVDIYSMWEDGLLAPSTDPSTLPVHILDAVNRLTDSVVELERDVGRLVRRVNRLRVAVGLDEVDAGWMRGEEEG